jgi:mxaA protein
MRQRHDARRLPYALAWRDLRRLDPGSAEAWRTVHRAIDASSGRVVHSATLPRLLAESPHLAALRSQLEAFYRHSDQRFFADDADATAFPLRELCRALRDAEKREHR